MPRARRTRRRRGQSLAAQRLFEAERQFLAFKELSGFRYLPFAKSFESFAAYERWKRAQKSPWYR
jgi:hypothetical protein